ncbi:MAG: TlpA family protein disulfide reductase [Bacteroidales bacterium]|nr:TlpA family protein disulfide reductase [Bacteroidales bacterium]
MYKNIKTLLCAFLLLAFSNSNAQKVSVQAKISGLKGNGYKAFVSVVVGNAVQPFDTAVIDAKGNLKFSAECKAPSLYLLNISEFEKNTLHLMLEPGDKVNFEAVYDDTLSAFHIVSAKGSDNIRLYQQFNDILYQCGQQARRIDNEYILPSTSERRKQELSQQMQQLQLSQNIAVRQLLEKNTNVLLSAFLVTYFDNDAETYADLFEAVDNGLKERYADNQFVKYVDNKVRTSLGPGRMAPEIEMKDPNGKIRKLSDLRGKVVMIDFWASWCRPCRMENPNVVKLYKKYHDKGFEIYSVSLDKSRDPWLLAIEQDGLEWPNHVSDLNGWTSSGGATYGITSVPSTVLIDRQGRIIARNLRGEQLANKLKEIFGE